MVGFELIFQGPGHENAVRPTLRKISYSLYLEVLQLQSRLLSGRDYIIMARLLHLVAGIVSVGLLRGVSGKLNGHCKNELGVGSIDWSGICVHTSTCDKFGGVYWSGSCPDDPNDVKCCFVNTCDPNNEVGYSYCEWTNHACPLGNPGAGTRKNSMSRPVLTGGPETAPARSRIRVLMPFVPLRSLPRRRRLQVLLLPKPLGAVNAV